MDALNRRKMHPHEIETDIGLVRRLLGAQFPQWAGLPIEPLPFGGTDNAIYRLGDNIAVRLPRKGGAATEQAEKEVRGLPRLAPHLPLAIPVPIAMGGPGEGYPWHWLISPWLEGEDATNGGLVDLTQAARDLAGFIAALRTIEPADGPLAGAHGRGMPLATRDDAVRASIAQLDGEIDAGPVIAAWDAALAAAVWPGPSAWVHGDIDPRNLLVVRGRLAAVLDFGLLNVGDPACDLMIAWTFFSGENRRVFHEVLAVDEASWKRGRGWALSWALIALPYYLHTYPAIVAIARRTIDEVLVEHAAGVT